MCVKTEATKMGFFVFCLLAGMGITYLGYLLGAGL